MAELSEKAKRVAVVKKNDLLARLEGIDPQKVMFVRFRTRLMDDSFGDSFSDSFGDSFSDSFGDSFGDSFSDSSALLPAQIALQKIKDAGVENLVGLEFRLHD